MSFAHAFYILLSPKFNYSFNNAEFNDDSNNPWNMNPKYKVFNDEINQITDSNQFIIEQPNENTNMFMNYGTALFAMYLFLTGIFFYILFFSQIKIILSINNTLITR
jgi:hypothetical protein